MKLEVEVLEAISEVIRTAVKWPSVDSSVVSLKPVPKIKRVTLNLIIRALSVALITLVALVSASVGLSCDQGSKGSGEE